MAKLIGHFRRRDGMDPAEFREYYETQHAPLGVAHFGHLFASYTRNYVAHELDGSGSPVQLSVDVVTEIVFKDDQAMGEMFALTAGNADLRVLIAEDEAKFMDRSASRIILVTDHEASAL